MWILVWVEGDQHWVLKSPTGAVLRRYAGFEQGREQALEFVNDVERQAGERIELLMQAEQWNS